MGFFVILFSPFSFDLTVGGETKTFFTPTDNFKIEMKNSSISFAVNGTYQQANLINGTWNFENLQLVNSPKIDLKVSARDSKVTIASCRTYNVTFAGERVREIRLRYTVVGQGIQTLNFGIPPNEGDWGVIFNDTYMDKNDGWKISPDGTLTVMGATANVTLAYYGFPESFRDNSGGLYQSILKQHSVLITTTIAVVIIIILAAAIRRKLSHGNDNGDGTTFQKCERLNRGK